MYIDVDPDWLMVNVQSFAAWLDFAIASDHPFAKSIVTLDNPFQSGGQCMLHFLTEK